MGNLKKLYGQRANCSGIYSGIFVLNTGIFWWEAKTKRLFSQCGLSYSTNKFINKIKLLS
jgi:hypothetical protein